MPASSTPNALPLNPALYAPLPDDVAFLKATTGIEDDEELKSHILAIQERVYKVAPYPCFYGFAFIKTSISVQPVYRDILEIGRYRNNAILLEVGCGLCAESRKAALDGFPARNIVSSDIIQEFGDLSHALFKTTKETFPGKFIAGDILDPAFLSVVPPTRGPVQSSPPDLSSLTSLSPLHGHCSVITATSFFHLFTEEQQVHLARALAGLLSPEPGSLICGVDMGAKVKGPVLYNATGVDLNLFLHSEESWTELWDGIIFEKGEVAVWAKYAEVEFMGKRNSYLLWNIKRLNLRGSRIMPRL
ncbi:hypothetical protein SCLCIDRAFT_1211726 [Scleroderma citrinum Foug A]|uniref:Methyltransferase domain-containing protein n=1 Tax=Scleroderma citrinum Foug A TaxID=1036808 RepID=A0A0C3EBP6_9AGAM|nr:hypothetical protein SCLCIDRAFT_1211726 [Scleroderma citrinum Foug A]